jgi:DNA-binding NarL/FixJ family response regulator
LIAQPLEGDHAEWNAAIAELGFSKQQARLIQLILEGKGDKQIAAEMGVRFGTIRTYLSRAFERTGTSGRMELAALVFSRVMFHRQQAAEKRP